MRRKNAVVLVSAAILAAAVYILCQKKKEKRNAKCLGTFAHLVGNTPLVRIESLSAALGIDVLGKAEFMNPGGSVKDRVAIQILQDAKLPPNGTVVEGTSGSTGISLTLAANSLGHRTVIFMPSDQAVEKRQCLKTLGADLRLTPSVSASHQDHYINQAVKEGKLNRSFFADQFENKANFNAHFNGTGKEILKQTRGRIDGFVASCGTGGTLSGCAARLKQHNSAVKIVAADPPGSGVATAAKYGVMFNTQDCEGRRKRVFVDSIVEGVGLNRLTQNFVAGVNLIDAAYEVTDLETVHMSRWLIEKDGLFCGSSSALNCCAVIKAFKAGVFKAGDVVAVILCDSGVRHLSRFYNDDVLQELDLLPQYMAPGNSCNYSKHGPATSKSVVAALSMSKPTSVFDFIDD